MWVYCPMTQKVPGPKKEDPPLPMPKEVSIKWGGKLYRLKEGINEIPEAVAQAYFVFALPESLQENEENFKRQVSKACERWGYAMGTRPPDPGFLTDFICYETREGLEDMLRGTSKEEATQTED